MSDEVRLKTNFPEKIADLKSYVKQLIRIGRRSILHDAMQMALQTVAERSVQKHMITTKVGEAIAFGTDTAKVTMRTGRLAGSIVGAWRFSQTRLPSTLKKFVKGQFKSSGEDFQGGIRETIREAEIRGSTVIGRLGSKVPYAAIHEFGGTISFKTREASVYIPPRPYLTPAATESRADIIRIFRAVVEETFKKQNI